MNRLCCLTALLFAAVSLETFAADSSENSGVEGVIFVSPSRPGPIRKDAPSRAPARDVQFVVTSGSAKVAAFKTDGEGHFQVSLPAGHYLVMREDPGAAVGHWTFEVDVVAGETTKVNWTGDSGMR